MRAGTFTLGDFALFVSYLWFTTQVPSSWHLAGDYRPGGYPSSVWRAGPSCHADVLVEDQPVAERKAVNANPSANSPAERLVAAGSARAVTYHYPGSGAGIEASAWICAGALLR